MSKLKTLNPLAPGYGFAVLILIGSSLPTSLEQLQRKNLIWKIVLSDQFIHFIAFAVLTILLSIGYILTRQSKNWWVYAALVSLFVGVLVELIQFFLPYRSFSVGDIGVDVLGIITALVLFSIKKKGDRPLFSCFLL